MRQQLRLVLIADYGVVIFQSLKLRAPVQVMLIGIFPQKIRPFCFFYILPTHSTVFTGFFSNLGMFPEISIYCSFDLQFLVTVEDMRQSFFGQYLGYNFHKVSKYLIEKKNLRLIELARTLCLLYLDVLHKCIIFRCSNILPCSIYLYITQTLLRKKKIR